MIVTRQERFIYKGRSYKTEMAAYMAAARDELLDKAVPTPVHKIAAVDTGPFDPSRFYKAQEELAEKLREQDLKADAADGDPREGGVGDDYRD